VEIVYRVYEKAYEHSEFDGVQFLVEYHPAQGPVATLLDDWVGPEQPASQRGNRTRFLPLPAGAQGEVVLRTLPGPRNNGTYDWALIDRLVIH
jgi:hypothetical protein